MTEEINDENPEWDGSEAELVSDDDAEEYEIPETGIKLSYRSLLPVYDSCYMDSSAFTYEKYG